MHNNNTRIPYYETPDTDEERWAERVKLLELRSKVARMVIEGKLDEQLEALAWYDGA